MNLDNKTLLRYLIIVISVVAVIALVNKLFFQDDSVLKEEMGNLKYDITKNTSNFFKNINDETVNFRNMSSDFLIQKDRFLKNQSSNIIPDPSKSGSRSMCRCGPSCKCQGMCHCGPNSNCGQSCAFYNECSDGSCFKGKPNTSCLSDQKFDNIDWSIKYEPGANGTVSDLTWNYMSPRMTLRCGCLKCKETDSSKVYDAPSGFPDGYTNSDRSRNIEYLDKATYAHPNSLGMMYDDINQPIIDGQTMSVYTSKNSTGIVPPICDCVNKNVQNSYTCNGKGPVKIFNFHK